MKCALLQLNPKIGDVSGNTAALLTAARQAAAAGARLCAAPQLSLLGCPPGDLLLYDAVLDDAERALKSLAAELANGPALAVGTAVRKPRSEGGDLYNRAVLLDRGEVRAVCEKRLSSPEDVLKKSCSFAPETTSATVSLEGKRLVLTLCSDIGNAEAFRPLSAAAPAPGEFDVLIGLAASPFTGGKSRRRERMIASFAARHNVHVLYANQAGANDECIFDGRSLHAAPGGIIAARGRSFAEDVVIADLDAAPLAVPEPDTPPEEEIREALVLGIRDYMAKTGFRRAVLGLSGGVDSALVAALACSAAGPENVTGLIMPSPWSSDHSVRDALELARNLNFRTITVPLLPALDAFTAMLAPQFAARAPDVTEENIQARIRGLLLMAHSNKFGALLLNTGNKSELSVGYCTLYGDMCGALAVIGDVKKTEVYRICRCINARQHGVIPENILNKAPSAELRPGQTDQDSLPPYDVLDAVLEMLLDRRLSVERICAAGYDEAMVRKIACLVARSEFKRRQAPPVLRVTPRTSGIGSGMPVACEQPYR